LKRLKSRRLYSVMTTLEGLICDASASLDACRETEQLAFLQNEVILLNERLESARERARIEWGTQFMQLAMEDDKAQFGDVEVPDTILEEDEEDEASEASTEPVPRAELEELASDVGVGGDAALASTGTPGAAAAPEAPAIFSHLPAGHPVGGDVPGRVFVDLSTSPDSIAQSADLDATPAWSPSQGQGSCPQAPTLRPTFGHRSGTRLAPRRQRPGYRR